MLTLCGSVLCAQASVVPNDAQSVLDQSTGLVWKEFKSLSEGEAQGYRQATDTEFLAVVAQAGLTPIDQTDGATNPGPYPISDAKSFSGTGGNVLLGMSNETESFVGTLFTTNYVVIKDIGLVANTQDNQSAYMLAALKEATLFLNGSCLSPGDGCDLLQTSEATLTRPDLIDQFSSTPNALGYYMVQTIPEVSPLSAMAMGLLGLAAARRRHISRD